MIFNFRRRALKSQTSRISFLFLLYLLIFLACAQLPRGKNVSDAENKDESGKQKGGENPKYRQTSQEKLDIFSSLGIDKQNTHTPISATTTKVTTLNSSSIIYSLTIITSKKNEFFFIIIRHQQLPLRLNFIKKINIYIHSQFHKKN